MSAGRLPVATGREVLRALNKAGFVVDRIVGSHHVLLAGHRRFETTEAGNVPAWVRQIGDETAADRVGN